MSKLWFFVSFVLISANVYPSYDKNTLVRQNRIEKFENDLLVKYEEKIKSGDDFLIKIVFFHKKKETYYGNEMRYVTSHKIYYHDKDGLDIKKPEEAFRLLAEKFDKANGLNSSTNKVLFRQQQSECNVIIYF